MKLTIGTVLAIGVAIVALVLIVVGNISVILGSLFIALAVARMVP